MKFANTDTLIARITPCLENGKTTFVDILEENEVGFGSTEYIVLNKREFLSDSNFVYYLSLSPRFRDIAIKSMVGSSGRQRVQTDRLANSEFAFPKLQEQQQIASILSSLDDKIELNRKMNKTLEEMGKALFKRWFVDFEFPFDFAQGKPDENGKPYKSSGGEMEDSELGEIPKGWKTGIIGDFANVKSGFAFKSSSFRKNGDYGVVKIKNVIDPFVDVSDLEYIFKNDVKGKAEKFILELGDILIAMSGNTTGKIGLVTDNSTELVLNQRVGKYFLKDKNYHWFIYFSLRNGDTQRQIIEKAYGSAQPNISPSILESVSIIVPDTSILIRFSKLSSELMSQYLSNYFESSRLVKIRDLLLPRLMSGKLRVKN